MVREITWPSSQTKQIRFQTRRQILLRLRSRAETSTYTRTSGFSCVWVFPRHVGCHTPFSGASCFFSRVSCGLRVEIILISQDNLCADLLVPSYPPLCAHARTRPLVHGKDPAYLVHVWVRWAGFRRQMQHKYYSLELSGVECKGSSNESTPRDIIYSKTQPALVSYWSPSKKCLHKSGSISS